jgi:hypothetical protein
VGAGRGQAPTMLGAGRRQAPMMLGAGRGAGLDECPPGSDDAQRDDRRVRVTTRSLSLRACGIF